MKRTNFESVADYLLMAAVLIEIKSRMLLPKEIMHEADEEDPRADLIKQLIEYEKFKSAAKQIDRLPRFGRDWLPTNIETFFEQKKLLEEISPDQLKAVILKTIQKKLFSTQHKIKKELWSTETFMNNILSKVSINSQLEFSKLTNSHTVQRKLKIVGLFIALLELIKIGTIRVRQRSFNSAIWIQRGEK